MENQELEQKGVAPKAATTKQLANEYNISERCLRTWIKKIEHLLGPKNGHYYTPKQVGIMHDNFGIPAILFGLFINVSESFARQAPGNSCQYSSAGYNPDTSDINEPATQDSDDLSLYVLHPATLFAAMLMLVYSMEAFALTFIDDAKRRISGKTLERKFLLRTFIALKIISACAVFVAAGYYFGKIIF